MSALKVVSEPKNLVNRLTTMAVKCDALNQNGFLILIFGEVLLSSIEMVPENKHFLKPIWHILSAILWGILFLVILSSFGRYFAFGSVLDTNLVIPSSEILANSLSRGSTQDKLIQDVEDALKRSRETALMTASDELDVWISDLMYRVDNSDSSCNKVNQRRTDFIVVDPIPLLRNIEGGYNFVACNFSINPGNGDFLSWFFGYWTQQKLGLDATLQAGKRVFDKNALSPKEKIQEEVVQEFTNRVLQPETAKLELKNIGRAVAMVYTDELGRNLDKIRLEYRVPRADWEEYLNSISVLATSIKGRQVPLDLKAFTAAGLGGGALLTKSTSLAIQKVTAKLSSQAVTRAGEGVIKKAGTLLGGEFLGPIVTVAIIAWDAVDIYKTGVEYKPVLKHEIQKYFVSMKKDILYDEQNGIQKVILDIEKSIKHGIRISRIPFLGVISNLLS